MSKRNNIVSMLMEKVPRRNRDNYQSTGSMDGLLLLVELDNLSEIADFLCEHRVFGEISSDDRRRMFNDLKGAATEYQAEPHGRTTYLLKIRLVTTPETGGLHTPLAKLGVRYARMYAITKDGARHAKYDRNQSSSTMNVEKFLEEAVDLPTIKCHCPDDVAAEDFDYDVNGIKYE